MGSRKNRCAVVGVTGRIFNVFGGLLKIASQGHICISRARSFMSNDIDITGDSDALCNQTKKQFTPSMITSTIVKATSFLCSNILGDEVPVLFCPFSEGRQYTCTAESYIRVSSALPLHKIEYFQKQELLNSRFGLGR